MSDAGMRVQVTPASAERARRRRRFWYSPSNADQAIIQVPAPSWAIVGMSLPLQLGGSMCWGVDQDAPPSVERATRIGQRLGSPAVRVQAATRVPAPSLARVG